MWQCEVLIFLLLTNGACDRFRFTDPRPFELSAKIWVKLAVKFGSRTSSLSSNLHMKAKRIRLINSLIRINILVKWYKRNLQIRILFVCSSKIPSSLTASSTSSTFLGSFSFLNSNHFILALFLLLVLAVRFNSGFFV